MIWISKVLSILIPLREERKEDAMKKKCVLMVTAILVIAAWTIGCTIGWDLSKPRMMMYGFQIAEN